MENVEKAIEQVKKELPCLELLENENMSGHCSFKIGGPVRAVAYPSGVSALTQICCILKENHVAPMMLGNCTNILFPDEGMQDMFFINTGKLTKMFLLPDGAVYAEAGVPLSKLAGFAWQNSLTGLEFASGIPGTLGGACMMNAGAYGGELKDCIESVVCYYLPEQGLCELTREECSFAYRSSLFRKRPGFVILSAVLRLEKGDSGEIAEKMRQLNEKRREKQPLDLPSAGSAFKRPEGHYAAQLIEDAGLKGLSVGGAQVSEKHAGFVVNKNRATSHDVHELMMQVRRKVYENSGVVLEPEIIILPPDFRLEDNGPAVPRNVIVSGDNMERAD